MKTMFNFGDPKKDFTPIADDVLGRYKTDKIPITSNIRFYNDDLQMIDAAYGPSRVLDSLEMMKAMGHIIENDPIIFLGSMGSLSEKDIKLDDLTVPMEAHCAALNREYAIAYPDKKLYDALVEELSNQGKQYAIYRHGSVYAVFDPSTDHQDYTNCNYDRSVIGLDCCESYIGLKFCSENKMGGAVLLYCSDDPKNHISILSPDEFDARALKNDMEISRIARDVLLDI